MLNQSYNLNYCFWVVLLLQEIVLLIFFFIFPKYLMLLFIGKVTTGDHLVLLIIKFTPVMLLWCFINTQSFVHDKSSSTSQLIKDKSRFLPNLIRYLSGRVSSTFKISTCGCSGCDGRGSWDPSGFGGSCDGRGCRGGHSSTFPIIFSLQRIYPEKPYHQYHQFHLYNNSTNFLIL